MEEHIFGTYATDALKLVHHRAMRRGLQHWHDLTPINPAPGEPIALKVRVGPDLTVSALAVYYTTDGSLPSGSRGTAGRGAAVPFRRVGVEWDSLLFDYLEVWEAVLPAQPDGTMVRYRIGGWAEDGSVEVFADWPDARRQVEHAATAFYRQQALPDLPPQDPAVGTCFTFVVDRIRPPDWAYDAVIYEIFPDRFYPGDGRSWRQTEDLNGLCGGTLRGIVDKLDYVAELGATAIWMTPIFPSPTHHGYDATDYRSIEPRLGTADDLRLLVREAHGRGIRVILDLVCNHISHQHPLFKEALHKPDSPYRAWFTFDNSPVGYRSFFGVRQMPQLNMQNPAAAAWMIDHARYWLETFDVDGYRLDFALGPGPDFWSEFTAACKEVRPDSFIFGEIVDVPEAVRPFIGRLDGNLDFMMEAALRKTYAYRTWSEADFARFVARQSAFYPPDFVLPTFLDNHDTDRFLFIAGDDREALRRAATAQMRLPGPPVIYYGTEVGLSQTNSKHGAGLEASRAVMPWGREQDRDLLAYYRQIIAERKARRSVEAR